MLLLKHDEKLPFLQRFPFRCIYYHVQRRCAADIRVVGLFTSPRKAHGGLNKQRETPPSGT